MPHSAWKVTFTSCTEMKYLILLSIIYIFLANLLEKKKGKLLNVMICLDVVPRQFKL